MAEALTTNKHLEELSISDNALGDDGILHLAYALRVNQSLKRLWLVSCGMTDMGLTYLAWLLQHNNALKQLDVYNFRGDNANRLTKRIVPVLTECLQNNHSLTRLELPVNLESFATSIENTINGARKRNGLPLIKVEGMTLSVLQNRGEGGGNYISIPMTRVMVLIYQ